LCCPGSVLVFFFFFLFGGGGGRGAPKKRKKKERKTPPLSQKEKRFIEQLKNMVKGLRRGVECGGRRGRGLRVLAGDGGGLGGFER